MVVVGAGITGLFTALFHKRRYPHHHVCVLERGAFPAGASVKNAGFACFGSPSELLADIDNEGLTRALERVEERWTGLRELRAELGDAAIGFEATGGHEVFPAHDPTYTLVAERFDALNGALHDIFGSTVFRWDDDGVARNGLGGIGHLVRTELEGALDSGALMRTLLGKCQGEGVLVRTSAEVKQLQENGQDVELALADGSKVRASQVLIATNGLAPALLPGIDVQPARGQVMVTTPIDGLRLRGTFHADQGFYYYRDYQGAVLIGGGRNLDFAAESTDREACTPVIQEALEKMLREVILPESSFGIAHRWSGIMGFRSAGKTPLVERRTERVSVAAGLGGMGVAIGIRVARKAADVLGDRV